MSYGDVLCKYCAAKNEIKKIKKNLEKMHIRTKGMIYF